MRNMTFSRRDVLKSSAALAATTFAAPLRAAAPEPSAITPALIDAAKKEGKLAFYTAMDLPVAEKLAKAFEAKFPGIAVRVERSGRRARVPAHRPGAGQQHPRRRRGQQRGCVALHRLEAQRLARALSARGGRQVFSGRAFRSGRPLCHHADLALLDRLQHRSGEGRGRAEKLCRPARSRNGPARSSRRIRPTAAPS